MRHAEVFLQTTNENRCVNNLQYYGDAENFEHGTRGRALIPLPPSLMFSVLLQWSLKRSRNSGFFKRQEPCLAVGQKHVFIKTNTLPSYLNYPVNMRQIQSPCGHILKHQIHRVKSLTGRVNSRERNVNPRNRLLGA